MGTNRHNLKIIFLYNVEMKKFTNVSNYIFLESEKLLEIVAVNLCLFFLLDTGL